jgi:hypothetical protein
MSKGEIFMKSVWASFLVIMLGFFLGFFASATMAQSKHVALFKNDTGDLKIIGYQSEIVPQAGTHIFNI